MPEASRKNAPVGVKLLPWFSGGFRNFRPAAFPDGMRSLIPPVPQPNPSQNQTPLTTVRIVSLGQAMIKDWWRDTNELALQGPCKEQQLVVKH